MVSAAKTGGQIDAKVNAAIPQGFSVCLASASVFSLCLRLSASRSIFCISLVAKHSTKQSNNYQNVRQADLGSPSSSVALAFECSGVQSLGIASPVLKLRRSRVPEFQSLLNVRFRWSNCSYSYWWAFSPMSHSLITGYSPRLFGFFTHMAIQLRFSEETLGR